MPIFVFLTHLKWIQLYFGFHKLSNFRMAIIIVNSKWACINTTIRCQAGNIWLESKSLLCYMEIILFLCYWSYVQRFLAVNLTICIQIEEVIDESVLTVNIGIQVTCIYARKTTILFSYVFVTYVEIQTQTFIKAS